MGGQTLSGRLLGCEGKPSRTASFLRDIIREHRGTRSVPSDNVDVSQKSDPVNGDHSSRVKRGTVGLDVDPLYYDALPEYYLLGGLEADDDLDGVGDDPVRARRGVDDNRVYPAPVHDEPTIHPEFPETGRWSSDEFSHPHADGLRPWPPTLKNPDRIDLLSLHPCSGMGLCGRCSYATWYVSVLILALF